MPFFFSFPCWIPFLFPLSLPFSFLLSFPSLTIYFFIHIFSLFPDISFPFPPFLLAFILFSLLHFLPFLFFPSYILPLFPFIPVFFPFSWMVPSCLPFCMLPSFFPSFLPAVLSLSFLPSFLFFVFPVHAWFDFPFLSPCRELDSQRSPCILYGKEPKKVKRVTWFDDFLIFSLNQLHSKIDLLIKLRHSAQFLFEFFKIQNNSAFKKKWWIWNLTQDRKRINLGAAHMSRYRSTVCRSIGRLPQVKKKKKEKSLKRVLW